MINGKLMDKLRLFYLHTKYYSLQPQFEHHVSNNLPILKLNFYPNQFKNCFSANPHHKYELRIKSAQIKPTAADLLDDAFEIGFATTECN